MWKFLMMLVISLMIDSSSQEDTLQSWGEGNNQFAFNLYNEVISKVPAGENIFFSPFSATTALTMTLLGARQNTADQMEEVLHLDGLTDPHETFQRLNTHLSNIESTLNIANKLFGSETYTFQQDFIQDSGTFYQAAMEEVDFTETEATRGLINTWVEDRTNDKIEELIKPGIISSDTVMVLTNAIYFAGNWTNAFEETETVEGKFYSRGQYADVQMMSKIDSYKYASVQELDCEIVELPYEGDDVSMYVMLPRRDISDLEQKLTQESLQSALAEMRTESLEISMPKFEVRQSIQLTEVLQDMGMTDLFTSNADLSGIGDGLYVSAVVHEAYIKVDEHGAEAAAATAVVVDEMSALPTDADIHVTLNRPFIHMICDKTSGAILFLGRMNKPTSDLTWSSCEDGGHDCPVLLPYTDATEQVQVSVMMVILLVICSLML